MISGIKYLLFFATFISLNFAFDFKISAQTNPILITDRFYKADGVSGGNVVFLVTDDGVIVVDAGTSPSQGKKIVEQIALVTDKPIRYVILTHYHMDHTAGLAAFPKTAIVIGHKNIVEHLKWNETRIKNSVEKDLPAQIGELKKAIEKYKKAKDSSLTKTEKQLQALEENLREMQATQIIYPAMTFDQSMTVYAGKDTIRIIYPGPAHTSCNLIVHFVNQKTVHLGDMLFNGKIPYIMWPDGPDTKNWVEQLGKIKTWNIDIVIPGHGEITDKSGIQGKIEYLTALRKAVADAIHNGRTLEQMQNEITLPAFKHLEWPQLLRQNIESVYKEMTKK